MRTARAILLLLCTAFAAPAQVRISELPSATNVAGAQFVIVQGNATKRIAESLVRTISATNVSGLGPFAISTNLAISNVSGLQAALDARLATNGTLAADNITGLGPFATRTNLVGSDISDFSNAVVAVAPPTTNASLLISGTLPDARLSTNVRSHIGLGWPALTNSNAATSLLGITAAGDVVAGTNALAFSNDVKFTTPTTTVLRFQSPYKQVDFLATDEPLQVGYNAPQWSFGSDDGGFRVKYGPSDTDWGAVLYLDNNDDGGIARTNLGLGPYATATNLTTANISDFGDEVLSILSQPAAAWKLAAYNGDPTIATNEYGMGWDELGRFTLQTPVGAFQLYGTGNPSVPTLYFPGKIVSQSFEAIIVNGAVKASMIYSGGSGGKLSADVIESSLTDPIKQWLNSQAAAAGIPTTNKTVEWSGDSIQSMVVGNYYPAVTVLEQSNSANTLTGIYLSAAQMRSNLALGPFATVTNLTSSNISDFSSAVAAVSPQTTNASALTEGTLADARLSTNVVFKSELIASNVSGLGPFAVATNLTSSNVADFASAVTALAPATTNASLLTSGTLPDARLSTTIARTSQLVASNIGGLGPFATATNLVISNVDGLQTALDGKLATNGTLPAGNIIGLGPFATATNLTSTNISDFSNAVTAIAPATTNASLLTSGTLADARLSTNVILAGNAALTNARPVAWVAVPAQTNSAGTAGQIAYTNNFLYLCVESNKWRRVLLGTW